jgi:large subunit ribosomal protein L25
MANLTLAAKKRGRNTKGELSRMRKEGRVPAIIYGLDKDPETIEVGAVDMRPHLSQKNHVIDLKVDGQSQQVMLKMVERDPIRKDLVHIDFLRVNSERPVIVSVPVTTHGVPVGVKVEGGVFSVMKKFVKLRSKVADIPEVFDIDVSDISQGTIFYVKDLKFPKGSFVTPGKTALFGVTSGKAEDAAAAAVAAATAATAAAASAASAPAEGAAPAKEGEKKEEAKGKEKK